MQDDKITPNNSNNREVFVSWSGEWSKRIAALLIEWIPKVLSVKFFFSPQDMSLGKVWVRDLSQHLATSKFGILVITPENVNSPWVIFEAGVLMKDFDSGRVIPYLVSFDGKDLETGPLAMLQATKADENGTMQLINAIRISQDNSEKEKDDVIKWRFNQCWKEFSEEIDKINSKFRKKEDLTTSQGSICIFQDQLETNPHLYNYINQEKYKNIYMIEYSSSTTRELIQNAIKINSKVNIYILLQHPKTGKEYDGQEKRIIDHLEGFYYIQKDMRNCNNIKILFYKQRASVRGRNFDDKLINLGWYKYVYFDSKCNKDKVEGHNGITILIGKDNNNFNVAKNYFNETFKEMWLNADTVKDVCSLYKDKISDYEDESFKIWCDHVSIEKKDRIVELSTDPSTKGDIIKIN